MPHANHHNIVDIYTRLPRKHSQPGLIIGGPNPSQFSAGGVTLPSEFSDCSASRFASEILNAKRDRRHLVTPIEPSFSRINRFFNYMKFNYIIFLA